MWSVSGALTVFSLPSEKVTLYQGELKSICSQGVADAAVFGVKGRSRTGAPDTSPLPI